MLHRAGPYCAQPWQAADRRWSRSPHHAAASVSVRPGARTKKVLDFLDVLWVNSGRCVAAEHLFTILIHSGELQVDKLLAALRANGFHRGFSRERIPRPYLLGETHPEFGEAPIP